MSIKSLDMRELHVWLWIVKHEKMATATDLYKAYIKFEYNIFQGTYVPRKTEGICAINKAHGIKQAGVISLIFSMYNKLRDGRALIEVSHFSKMYSMPYPPPKELF